MVEISKSELLSAVLDAWQKRELIQRSQRTGDCEPKIPRLFHEAIVALKAARGAAKDGGCSDAEIADAEVTAAMEF